MATMATTGTFIELSNELHLTIVEDILHKRHNMVLSDSYLFFFFDYSFSCFESLEDFYLV